MNSFQILAAVASSTGTPTRLDPVKLFLDADIVVQAVMAGLLLASVWVWAIIVAFSLRMASARRCSARAVERPTGSSRGAPPRSSRRSAIRHPKQCW